MVKAWRELQLLKKCESFAAEPMLAGDFNNFQAWWDTNSGKVTALRFTLQPIFNETLEAPTCYKSFADCVEAIAGHMLAERCMVTIFINQAAAGGQRPGVLAVFHEAGAKKPLPHHMLVDGHLVYEGKPGWSAKYLNGGYTQMIHRCHCMRVARQASTFTLAGGITDNRCFLPVFVTTGDKQLFVTLEAPLKLLRETEVPVLGQWATLDTSQPAFKELCFTIWFGVKRSLLAAAAEPNDMCLRPGQHICVLSSDPGQQQLAQQQLMVESVLTPPRPSGCAYMAAAATPGASSSSMKLLVKVGPAPGLARQAEALQLSRLAWTQVEREAHMRQLLGDHQCPGLPRTVALGYLDLPGEQGAHHPLQGAAVVVTELCGEPLLAHDATQHPVLAREEVSALVRQLLVPLVFLQCHGIMHGDIHVRNMGRDTSSSEQGPAFYIFDLGTASTAAERQEPGWEAPISPLFSCQELTAGEMPGPLADLQSLVFVAMMLAGMQLPWAAAAAAQDSLLVWSQKVSFMQQPSQLPGWQQLFPADLQQVLEEVLATSCSEVAQQQRLLDRLARKWLPATATTGQPAAADIQAATRDQQTATPA